MLSMPKRTASITAVASILACAAGISAADAPQPVRFNRDIRPIMSNTCFACHGPATQKAKLRLDVREDAIKPREDGTPIVPGKADQSEIIKRIFATDEDDIMPPVDSHKTLTAAQKETIKRWVAEGAAYEKHWSYEQPVKAPLPKVEGAGYRVANAVDAFIADRLRQEKLTMSPEADRPTLIRRAAFALTGLPPTPAEVDAFVNDKDAKAYEKMVDRYLAGPRFGEEMARHWLDLARYADTHGMHLDNERQTWAYRDCVIKSFNDNKPFDHFTVEQIAGDQIPSANTDQVSATGFLRNNITTGEGGSIDSEWLYRNAVDRASTVASTWLAMTAGCAVCHDHKFDPISAKEYYSFYAFFYSNADPALDGNALLTQPVIKLMTPQAKTKIEEIDAQLAVKQKELDEAAAKLTYSDPATIEPRGPSTAVELVFFDDEFPKGARITNSNGQPTAFVTADKGKVHSGKKAIKRTDKGLGQDVAENTPPQAIPADGKLFAYVWIDPVDQPKTIMLQYYKNGWLHRAVWGEYDLIQWGAVNTFERVHIAKEIPKVGEWVRLEVDAARLGFKPGDEITGFAVTQFDGTVYWDKVGVKGVSDPALDPRKSLLAWWKSQTGKDTAGAPADVNGLIKGGPEKKLDEAQTKKVRDFYLQTVCLDTKPTLEPITQAIAALKQQRTLADQSVPSTFVFRDLPNPRQAMIMMRGAYDKPGEKVEPDVPAILPPLKKEAGKRPTRLDLANWLVSPEHPLTARVAVNRYWQQFFGTGLVKTSDDFGSQGEVPSHPELLDWLAVQFRESGWNTKQFVKLLVTSAAFRQSSRVTPELYGKDPDNRLYARGPRFRLDAEQIRDNALFAGGLMDLTMGGKGVKPYQPPNIWEPVGFSGSNTANYVQDKGNALYRRSIYTFLKRTAPPPFMSNFDAPSREAFCAKRERSNSPLQALQLMNDVQHIEAARMLAQRMMTEGGATPEERITYAYRTLLSRSPDAEELAIVKHALAAHIAKYEKTPVEAAKLIAAGESKSKAELKTAELAGYTMVANLLLNLDETLNRN